jgi:hypothetical protein
LQNSLRETRSQPASQPAAAKRTIAKAQRETERKIKAHFGFGLQEGRPTSVTGPTYSKPKWVIVSFHFPSTRYPSGPAKDNTWLPSYTDQRSCNCKAKKSKANGEERESSSQQVFFRVFGVGGDFSHLITAAFPHTTNKPYKIPWLVITCNLNKL